MGKINKARFWTGVLYPENMKETWEMEIGDIVQYSYAYCKHFRDRDSKSEHRKDHVHLILAFPNTTTYQHALTVFGLLSADGKKALNKVEACVSIRNVYDYLIHDTETCRKQGKEQYSPSERITGNNFDIGAYEQLGTAEKNEMFISLSNAIRDNKIFNYMDFYEYVVDTYEDVNYIEVMRCYSRHFQQLCDGNYQKWKQGRLRGLFGDEDTENGPQNVPSQEKSTQKSTENTTKCPLICCPECGSVNVVKRGKTAAQSQRWGCNDCGKRFLLE